MSKPQTIIYVSEQQLFYSKSHKDYVYRSVRIQSNSEEAAEPAPKRFNQKRIPPAITSTSSNMAPSRSSTRQRQSTLAKAIGDPFPTNNINESDTRKKPLNFNIDSLSDQIYPSTKPSLKSLIQEMGFADKSPEYKACIDFLEAISPKNKAKHTDEVIDLISSDESLNKMDILYIDNKLSSNITNTNANKEATQEEHEKLEDDNNNQEVDKPIN